jgi:formiminotetrahydrofolate cyclodeaminase
MMCARTAVLGALLNVRINLSSLDDAAWVEQTRQTADKLEAAAIEKEQQLLKWLTI